MNILDLIISALVSGCVGSIMGILFSKFWRAITYIRPVKKMLGTIADDSQLFLGVFKKQGLSFYELGPSAAYSMLDAQPYHEQGFRLPKNVPELTSMASARCLAYILATFKSIGLEGKLELVDSAAFPHSYLGSNIICIGGPETNETVRKIFKMEDTWFPYLFEGEGEDIHIVREEEDNNRKRWPSEKDHSPYEDFGVIIKTQNKGHPKKWILVLAGLGTLATVGVGYFFNERIKEISKKYKRKKFGMVIKVDSRHGYRFAREIDSVTFND